MRPRITKLNTENLANEDTVTGRYTEFRQQVHVHHCVGTLNGTELLEFVLSLRKAFSLLNDTIKISAVW